MTELIALVIALQILTIAGALVWFYLWQRPLFVVDARRIAAALVDDLLRDYRGELHLLSEDGTKQYAREKYGRFANETGLPLAPADYIASLVWGAIQTARGDTEPQQVGPGFSFYE